MNPQLFTDTVRRIAKITGYPEREAALLLEELEERLIEKNGLLEVEDMEDCINRMIKRNLKA